MGRDRVFIESVLPSGRGVKIEKIDTRALRQAQGRVADRLGANTSAQHFGIDLIAELIMVTLRAITEPLPWKYVNGDESDADIDAMLEGVKWDEVTYLELTKITDAIEQRTHFDDLFADPEDYGALAQLVQQEMGLAGTGGRAASLRGKRRLTS